MKNLVYKIFIPFSKLVSACTSKQLRVIAYHTVPEPAIFDKQLRHLKTRYNVIGIQDLLNYIKASKELPENSILITFDDGDFSVYEYGLPLLAKYSFPSILFVITDLINSNDDFWWKQIERHYDSNSRTYQNARKKINELKKVSNKERELYLKGISGFHTRQLTTGELLECERKGMHIGNHTASHPMIDRCSAEEIKLELNKTKKSFNEWKLSGYNIFAYPNGNWEPISEKILVEKGVKLAFLFDHKINRSLKNFNPMRISRIRVSTDTPLDEFKVKVSGLHSRLMNMKDKLKG